MYIFTNEDAKEIIEVIDFNDEEGRTHGEMALERRKALSDLIGEGVIAWTKMGGDNGTYQVMNK